MHQLTSPRLPGVPILEPHTTGPAFSRWRRSVKFALETKGTWKYCNGACPMPMPEARPNSMSPVTPAKKTQDIQPSLLEERRAWVRQDREVKLDIFLSLAEEVMQDVFEVGPPLPPFNLNAQGMLEALDERFLVFKFEAYHHAFCHFLNLHIDQYTSIDEFNQEFSATLEDLLDHGHPLSNTQACSAYFSKLRCTQNPWVAKKLEEWDAQSSEPELVDLLREAPPWSFIRPLTTKSSQNFRSLPIPEEQVEEGSAQSDSDALSEPSVASIASSRTSHSRHASSITAHSQEITVHASSEDIVEIDPPAFRKELENLPAAMIPERRSSKNSVPKMTAREDTVEGLTAVPEWLSAEKRVPPMPLPAPIDRPLPPLPQTCQKTDTESPRIPVTVSETSPQANMTIPTSPNMTQPTCAPVTQSPQLHLETTHPTLRPRTPTPTPPLSEHPAFRVNAQTPTEQLPADMHPALRPTTPTPTPGPATAAAKAQATITSTIKPFETVFLPLKLPDFPSSPPSNLAVPWPSTPDIPQRPHTSPFHPENYEPTQRIDIPAEVAPTRGASTNSSIINLPVQGSRESAWSYLHQTKDSGSPQPSCEHSVSPIELRCTSPPGCNITALPQLPKATLSRAPNFDDSEIPVKSPSSTLIQVPKGYIGSQHTDLVASSDEAQDRASKAQKHQNRRKKNWSISMGVNLARFSYSKGVREII